MFLIATDLQGGAQINSTNHKDKQLRASVSQTESAEENKKHRRKWIEIRSRYLRCDPSDKCAIWANVSGNPAVTAHYCLVKYHKPVEHISDEVNVKI